MHERGTTQNVGSISAGTSLLELSFAESFEELEALETEWCAFDAKSKSPSNVFQTFPWCWHWAKFAANGENAPWRLKILTGRQNGQLVLIWPLAITRGTIVSEARWLGEPLTQYGDVILADDPAREVWLLEAWRHINEQKDIDLLHLRKVRHDANVYPLIESQMHKLPGSEFAPCISIKPFKSFDELNKTYNSKRRRNRARYRRRLDELGNLQFQMITPCGRAEEILTTALEFKNAWLKNSGRHNAAFENTATVATLQSMLRGEEHPVGCLISILHLDEEPLAIEIGFTNHNHYFSHIGAFNPWFRAHSPGTIQTEDTIGELIERGYETYDMMAPDDRYKTEWASQSVEITDHAIPITLRGVTHLGLYLKLLRPGLKALYQRMPNALKRRAAQFT